MAGPGTNWSGPLMSGTMKDAGILPGTTVVAPANTGLAVLSQVMNFAAAGTQTISLPAGSIPLRVEGAALATGTAGTATFVTGGSTVATIGAMGGTATGTWVPGVFTTAGINPATYATTGQPIVVTVASATAATQIVLEYIQTVNLTAFEP